ncbi:six-cysteine ranthipeptide SCIFF [Nocardia puris]|nr:six-cysteine ranthipeptide SCIFF [Nocardia puris]MBF6364710.1 six-cysteine ranthipeptide SCIFF [Nocardia puris]MBF6463138.1 six-cysteine ranthipeptide SCIFF [Nocardia puris]
MHSAFQGAYTARKAGCGRCATRCGSSCDTSASVWAVRTRRSSEPR